MSHRSALPRVCVLSSAARKDRRRTRLCRKCHKHMLTMPQAYVVSFTDPVLFLAVAGSQRGYVTMLLILLYYPAVQPLAAAGTPPWSHCWLYYWLSRYCQWMCVGGVRLQVDDKTACRVPRDLHGVQA